MKKHRVNKNLRIYQRPNYYYLKKRKKNKKIIIISIFLIIISAVAYFKYLNIIIKEHFSNPYILATKVFSEPISLKVGEHISKESFKNILDKYSISYEVNNNTIDIKKDLAKVVFNNTKIQNLYKNNIPVNEIKLSEVFIGFLKNTEFKDYKLTAIEEFPQELIDMLLMIEDKRFYSHIGIDFIAIFLALYDKIFTNEKLRGASTITQQLIKNSLLSREKSLLRKIQEIFMSIVTEQMYSKDFILENYLNTAYFAQDKKRAIHGFPLASEYYFNKPLNLLNTEEIALLVAMTKGVFFYHPILNPSRTLKRRNLVLLVWYKNGRITETEYKELIKKPLNVKKAKNLKNHHIAFLDLINRQLQENYSIANTEDNLNIFSTLDVKLQNHTEKVIEKGLLDLELNNELKTYSLQTAVIINDRQDNIKALIGDRYKEKVGFNRALDAKRHIGSLIKPVIYLAALSEPDRFNLLSILDDSEVSKDYFEPGIESYNEVEVKNWQPKNFDNKSHGKIWLINALAHSYNQATVRLGFEVDINTIARYIKSLGVKGDVKPFPSLLLGAINLSPLEVANIYQTIMSNGYKRNLNSILKVNKNGASIKANLKDNSKISEKEFLYLIQFAMREVVKIGTAERIKETFDNIDIAAKTGSTNDLRDSWIVTSGDKYTTTIWIGRDDNKSIYMPGSNGALGLFVRIFKDIGYDNLSYKEFTNIKIIKVDKNNNCNNIKEIPYLKGFKPEPENWFLCG